MRPAEPTRRTGSAVPLPPRAVPRAALVLALIVMMLLDGLAGHSQTSAAASPEDAAVRADPVACPNGLVALTFDDGPGGHTGAVLDVLDAHGVPGTFFAVGSLVTRRGDLVRRASEAGHEIANHSHTHPMLARLSNDAIRSEIRRADAAIRAAGVTPLMLLRPPYGSWDGPGGRVAQVAASLGYRVVTWNVDPTDYRATTAQIRSRVRAGLRNGAVILLHDGSGNAPRMIAALPGIIRDARDRGYCFGVLDAQGRVVEHHLGVFSDIAGSVHREAIERLAEAGITQGCNPPLGTRYCPDDAVTRAQLATLLVTAMDVQGLALPEAPLGDGAGIVAAEQPFVDVPEGSTHAEAIHRLAAAGVTQGCNPPIGDHFCPGEPLTRAQLASLLVAALDLDVVVADELHPPSQWYLDVPPNTTHAAAITCLAGAGITQGCDPPENTCFCPEQTVTRGQIASFLVRAVLAG